MQKVVFMVRGMSCGHCVKAVQRAVGALPGTGGVAVDLEAGTAAVEYDPAQSSLEQIRRAIEDQGYDVL